MSVRVRYMPNELGEGAVDVFLDANWWQELEDGGLALYWATEDDNGKRTKRKVGMVPAGRWESVITQEDAVPE